MIYVSALENKERLTILLDLITKINQRHRCGVPLPVESDDIVDF